MIKNWYRLDNAALIFPAVSGKKAPNTFCLSAVLDDDINKEVLQKSLCEVVKSEDNFRVRLKKGVFWYYLEENPKQPVLLDDQQNFMEYIDPRYGDNFLFRVYAGKRTIKVVFFHVLTDGTGGLYFLKQLLYQYYVNMGLKISTEGLVKPLIVPTNKDEIDDKFLQVKPEKKEKKIAEARAFKLVGQPFKTFGTGIILAKCETEKVKTLAKQFDTTVTGYLAGIYIFSLYKAYIENKNVKNKTIALSIPINIRKLHPSSTKRNFTLVVRLIYDFSKPATVEDVITSCAKQLKEKITTSQIDAQIKFNTSAEKNVFIKLMPRVLKDLMLKFAFHIRSTKQETTNLSNLGKIELPTQIKKHIKEMYFILHTTNLTQKNFSVVGVDNELFFAFSRRHVETQSEKWFFRYLSQNGVDVVVKSNYQEIKNEAL